MTTVIFRQILHFSAEAEFRLICKPAVPYRRNRMSQFEVDSLERIGSLNKVILDLTECLFGLERKLQFTANAFCTSMSVGGLAPSRVQLSAAAVAAN